MNEKDTGKKISHLQRREIQAPVAAVLIRGLGVEIGREKAIEVAASAIRADAIIDGRRMAERYGSSTLEELARVVKEVWAEDDAISIKMLEETDRKLSFDVVRCRYAELYDRLKMRELGSCLSCSRDEAFTEGFNPLIKLIRTQTIMEGAPTCDFRFTRE
ncbi:MAG: L-2-amino-thiazoline-4-carboxylic acid hydrolase [PVC group bacterium]